MGRGACDRPGRAWAAAPRTAAHARSSGYLCLIRRKVIEFAGKVYVNLAATPS